MFSLKRREQEPSKLDQVIDNLISAMRGMEEGSAEHNKALMNLTMLLETKAKEPRKEELSINTIVSVAGSLAGILMILIFERKNVITSKALNFSPKPRT